MVVCLRPMVGGALMAAVSLAVVHVLGGGLAGLAAAIVASCVAYLPVVYSILALLKRSMASGGELEEDSQIHGRQEDLGGPESETGHVAAVSRAPSDLPGTHACTWVAWLVGPSPRRWCPRVSLTRLSSVRPNGMRWACGPEL